MRKPALPKSDILLAAMKTVDGRMAHYGNPTESWTRIGRMWGALLGIPDIPAGTCCLMMAAMKNVRETYEHNEDNNMDACGYTYMAERIALDKERGSVRSFVRRVWDGITLLASDTPYK